ncbi:bestrophin, RFP-TM, chloride channel family protein [Aspergillus niger]|nr:bestrophin, RFP-TM, chloride channel family protein [Aspergillus niger]
MVFQGHEVTNAALNTIVALQIDNDEPWNMPSGYASLICDDRDPLWWRLYVGQCSLSWRRIVCQHAQQIMNNSTASLYYFNLWIGNGHRYARFIKLWSFPKDTVNDTWYQACSNLLEALFCKAFRTHHGMLNRLGSEHQDDGKASSSGLGWGLNIMSPLVQGNTALNKELRTKANAGPSKAPDRQIQHWAVFNSRQKSAAGKQREVGGKGSNRAVFQRDFDKALRLALHNDEGAFEEVKESLQLQQKEPDLSEDLAYIPFCGSLTSEVAAILDYAAVSGADDMPMRASNNDDNRQTLTIPWSLDGCGFTENNILVWTYDFRDFASIGLKHLGHDILTDPGARRFHETLLATSQAKIVFLCGPQSEKLIRAIVVPSRHTLSLRGFDYTLYRDTVRNRLFICCPPLPAEIWSVSARHSIKISEALRFAVNFIPSLKHEIRPFFCENSSVVGYILRQARKERLGGEALTADTVDEGVRLWLARRNMGKAEDIKEIEKIGGSLTRGLLMVLKFLPRRPKSDENKPKERCSQPSGRITERVRVHKPFDMQQYQKMGDFVHKRLDERETDYRNQLSQLRAETPWPQGEGSLSTGPEQGGSDVPSTDLESIAALRSFSRLQGQEPQAGAEEMQKLVEQCQAEAEDRDYETPTSILQGLTARVIDEGFLDSVDATAEQPVIAETGDKKRQGVKSVVWKNEGVQNTEYSYNLKDQLRRHIFIYYCEILFPDDMDIMDGKVFVKLELCPRGETHTSLYATSSSEAHDDPALRLAFRIRYTDSFGREVVYYATNSAMGMVFKANTFVEVLEKKSLEEISQSPRRFIHIGNENTAHPLLERFRRGAHTSPLPR